MKSPKYPVCCSVFLLALLSGFALTAFAQHWEQLTPLGSPPSPRSDSSAAYDPSSNSLIVFGGRTGINVDDPNVYLNDVWVLTNANGLGGTPEWMELHPTGDLPAPRDDASVVYDASSNTLILFGGHRVIDFNDVHVLSNANGLGGEPRWTELSPTGSELPHTRRGSSAVYDPQTNRMIVFGGDCNGCAGLNDTWVLTNANGSGGTPEWIRLNTGGAQPPPGGAVLAGWDPASNRMTIFGVLTLSTEVWVLENANGLGGNAAWSLITPAGVGPSSPRTDPEGGVDLGSRRMIVYGGQDWLVGGAFSDSWVLLEFNGLAEARWVQVNPVNAPPPARYHPVGAYDEQSNRLIVFGGSLTPTCCTELQPLNDVWVLSNANGNQPPVANAGPDQTVIVGETVTLDGSGSHDPDGTIASFSWDFGDNTTGSGDITTHTYSAAGTYPVVLTVTDNAGASSTDTATVTVLTTGQAIQSLTSIVQSFDLRQGITTSLDAKIQNALDAMSAANAGARSDAANKLMAFINSVEAQRGKQLTNAQADTLEALARRILAVI